MPGSGWPFTRADLMPFYDRACDLLGIARFDYDPESEFDAGRPPLAAGERYTTATRHFSPVRGGPGTALAEYKRAVTDAPAVHVLLHANALELETDAEARRVTAVRAGTLKGNGFAVRARAVVLAAGGIENARLLLLSRPEKAPRGLGNAHDVVGRYFSNHATFGPGAALGFTAETDSLDLYTTRDPRKTWGVLALRHEAQARAETPNFTVTMGPADGPAPEDERALLALAAHADGGYVEVGEPARPEPVPVYFMLEQRQNAASRLVLDESQRDALGLPRTRLDWRFTAEDEAALAAAVRGLAAELGALGLARVRCEWPEGTPLVELGPSRHHLGTSRMHPDPAHGVVDADARVHGVETLHVAGSSDVPTGGTANPTLTVIALTLRLADHLAQALAR
jgi:choline dehydrogenase-like flavoprotein